MLENIDWGFIMDVAIGTIAGALIGVGGSILLNWWGNRKGYKNINSKIGSLDDTTLSGQHHHIEEKIERTVKEHSQDINNKIGSLENTTLAGQNDRIIESVQDVKAFLEKEKEDKIERQIFLSNDVRRINRSIEDLSDYKEIMNNLSVENSRLRIEKSQLLEENQKLRAQIEEYEWRNQERTLQRQSQDHDAPSW